MTNHRKKKVKPPYPFEQCNQPVISRKEFVLRVLRYFSYSTAILLFSLLIGMAGYSYFGNISRVDAFYNASMILTGMGPGTPMEELSKGCRIFAGVYALYSGLAFLTMSAILISPLLHRLLHGLHLDFIEKDAP
ncbi:hypothetical protein C7N43_30865 [Sphingobacteriales bacterium UPWRP_1]|nr:hypothetical protein BVG80_18750 [Sphingobacteriales bacterium TSM_CSM]PSJ73086.1 hypothetical protein C7N43_30865 [Sphingobacteriales bacterium UPWRP_1]